MRDVQEKLLELLTDIDGICKRENIKYYLCEETAHGAIMEHSMYDKCYQANIAMTTDDVRKFMKVVKNENRADRVVDSMMSNKDYPEFTVRYGDPNTMVLELPYTEKGKIPCIAVTIHMIRFKPRRMKKYYRFSSAFWKVCHKEVGAYADFYKKAIVFGCHVVKKVFGEAMLSRWLFKSWCSVFSENKKAKKVAVGTGKFVFDAEMLEDDTTIMMNGQEFPVFTELDTYLNKKYACTNFRKMKPKFPVLSDKVLVSCHVPYDKYLEKAKEMGVDFDAITRDRLTCSRLEQQVSKDNKKINQYYAIVDRTEKRFAMYERYMPMKKLLKKLYEEERYEELNELLKPYRSALWACYKKGLGLCFDKEIFELTMEILKREGSYTYVKKLRKMVPESHWEPLVVTDYKGDLVEINDISEVLPEYTAQEEESAQ